MTSRLLNVQLEIGLFYELKLRFFYLRGVSLHFTFTKNENPEPGLQILLSLHRTDRGRSTRPTKPRYAKANPILLST